VLDGELVLDLFIDRERMCKDYVKMETTVLKSNRSTPFHTSYHTHDAMSASNAHPNASWCV